MPHFASLQAVRAHISGQTAQAQQRPADSLARPFIIAGDLAVPDANSAVIGGFFYDSDRARASLAKKLQESHLCGLSAGSARLRLPGRGRDWSAYQGVKLRDGCLRFGARLGKGLRPAETGFWMAGICRPRCAFG